MQTLLKTSSGEFPITRSESFVEASFRYDAGVIATCLLLLDPSEAQLQTFSVGKSLESVAALHL